jgi:hypothetical protein
METRVFVANFDASNIELSRETVHAKRVQCKSKLVRLRFRPEYIPVGEEPELAHGETFAGASRENPGLVKCVLMQGDEKLGRGLVVVAVGVFSG